MHRFVYAVAMVGQPNGDYLITCRDLPEVITDGETRQAALEATEGALQAAIEFRIQDNDVIPLPSPAELGEVPVSVPISTALKAALYLSMREQGISKAELARLLGVDEKEVRRMLDPRHSTKVPTLEKALHLLGKQAQLSIV